VRLCLVASKPTDSVILGFLPAAARLGLEVVLLTDQPEEHERARVRSRQLGRPGCPRPGAEPGAEHAGDGPPARFLGCDVWDARELICAIAELPAPHAIVSNSDHLQAQTALAAAYLTGDHCDFVLSDLLGVDLFDLVLRVHLGESLPAQPPRPWGGTGHAVIDYVVADRSGTLTAVPPAGARPTGAPEVLLSFRPLREAGDHIVITHTNRDYLGVISAIGTDATAVAGAVSAARSAESWPIAVARW
jgi:hypothetical protein